jgi:hypothetical protein
MIGEELFSKEERFSLTGIYGGSESEKGLELLLL